VAAAADLGDTMRDYLGRAGRMGERDRWAHWLAEQVAAAGWSEQTAATEIDAAWALLSQGRPQEAIERLEALIRRLQATTEFDPAFQLAMTRHYLGRIYDWSGLAERAIPVLQQAVGQWEALGKDQRGNLAACLGDLANALMGAGRLDEALEVSERALKIVEEMGHDRSVAAGHGQIAQILAMQGRYAEAEAHYERALRAARAAGDQELEGTALQHQGGLAYNQGDLDRAARLFKQGLKRFQAMNAEDGIMQTCNQLGNVEQLAGRLEAAQGWYERARELARRRGDTEMLGMVAQNLGIAAQREGQAAREAGDETLARQKFQEAVQSIQESFEMKLRRKDRVGQAASLSQLGRLYLLLGDLEQAEDCTHQAREIYEQLNLVTEVWKQYAKLEEIAQAREDAVGAAEWRRKKEAVLEELERRAGGGVPQAFVQAVRMLCLQVGRAALAGEALPPAAEESLAALEDYPAPWGQVGGFLRVVAAGRRPLPPVPSGLPEGLEQVLKALKGELGA
jgi:tetratricopeptide (TPR) repeat protein